MFLVIIRNNAHENWKTGKKCLPRLPWFCQHMPFLDPRSLLLKLSILQGGEGGVEALTTIKTELIKTCSRYAIVVKIGKHFKKI